MNQSRIHAALSTMILLDPDLDPDPSPHAKSAKRTVGGPTPPISRDLRLPSARTVSRFLAAAQAAVRLNGQVTVLLTTDAAIRKLNHQFRGKNKPTDVLSFPAEGLGAQGIAGDLAISVTTAMGHAAEQGHSLSTEIKVLILHGLLHLAGYDHEIDDGKMARRERQLRARLRLPQGLIERITTARVPQVSPLKPGKRQISPTVPVKPKAERRVPQVSPLKPGRPRTSSHVPSKPVRPKAKRP